ncbi:Uncharacterized conserved protein HemY, contains two TPR repeats [Alkalispirochaeta americana]|uniref:Uncharacterized conserved protein HemY, contains two TPR repeats n=1 Tax=Alkalispirochaeta americana TaxID=159291 RepID=A0A1N6P340_9SPIO|nr:tetratricopeptide repeat protein [Alkalispirochaeta americana]SIP98804.1 Uncharacterized conserved protein HemY, contains two TPR repeats [Alkalispirochaeta americana]
MTSVKRQPKRVCFPLFLVLFLVPALWIGENILAETPPEQVHRGREALRRGVIYYERDEILAAADLFRKALEANPRYGAARMGLGEALFWLEDYRQAEDHLQEARRLRYPGVALDLLEAKVLVLTDRLDQARERYRAVLARQPYQEEALIGMALLDLAEGKASQDLSELRSLERRFPESRLLLTALLEASLAREDAVAVRRYLSRALQYHGEDPSVQLLAARFFLDQGRYEEALFHGRSAVGLAPELQEGWLVLAQTALGQGDMEGAREHYEHLLSLDPEQPRIWYARGVLAARQGDLETAYRSWERAQRLRPDYELSRIALENTLLAEEPLDSPRRHSAAEVYLRSGQEFQERFLHRQAERHFRRGLQLNPFHRELRLSLAELYRKQGFRGRFLQELEIVSTHGDESDQREARLLADRIEIFERLLRDSVARRWHVDQFTAPRRRVSLAIHHGQTRETGEPEASRHIGEYAGALLAMNENISLRNVVPAGRTPVETLVIAREQGAELVLLLTTDLSRETVSLEAVLLEQSTGNELFSAVFTRDGVDRIDRALRDLVAALGAVVLPAGEVLQRRGDLILVSLGAADGIEPDSILELRESSSRGALLGTARVLAVDDLLAEARYSRPQGGVDALVPGALVRPGKEGESEEAPPGRFLPTQEAPPSRVDRFLSPELLQRLFRLR